jgi:hypothetical protein
MKRHILMATTAMLISMAAFAGNGTKAKTTCDGNCCKKECATKCTCDKKNCTPENCSKGIPSDKSKSCTSCTHSSGKGHK